jgi:hypothetical protein
MTGVPQAPGERGVILIAVLLSVAIMAVMVVAATALTRSGIGSERLDQRRMATHFALRSGLEVAKGMILAVEPEERLFFDGEPVTVDVGQGILISASIRDAASFIDLNRSDPELIEALAQLMKLDGPGVKDLASRIAKLREDAKPEKDKPAVPSPAPTPAADPASPPQANPGQPGPAPPPPPVIFLAVEQIGELLNVDSAQGEAFTAGLTIFNPTGKINPMAAGDDVLQVIPGLTKPDLAVIAAARLSRSAKDDARLQQVLQRTKDHLSIAEPKAFVIELRLEEGPNLLPGSRSRAVVLLADGQLPFRTLAAGGE